MVNPLTFIKNKEIMHANRMRHLRGLLHATNSKEYGPRTDQGKLAGPAHPPFMEYWPMAILYKFY
jgi:hypothetical protein